MRVVLFLLLSFSWSVSAEVLNLNNVPVRDFIEWYSARTGQAIIVPPLVTGTVTVFNYRVEDDGIKALFDSVMLGLGYGVLPGNPALIVSLDVSAPLN
ncbi:TPA: hypothetical protein G8N95_004774 [Salmonella enterica]|uniref:GspD-like N0 domain-containing protein n=1 Tax=Salmonella enterica TaxID=28901 RepID=A0A749ZCD0_SALER|nr:hypothetical protein [Salmonella enterica subsp. enterica serovar Potsdam]EBR0172638.1 hypothetical protein [Salmonella enterica subsp. enterica serovar Mikawasima]EBX6498301.1 hypothetical protein [Salmonella enterica subsp. enterica serovar Abony]ECJ6128090.1 hypothetical protein [Salmonella enterica]EDV4904226.1 hypothetical protein [Salmonella enterica subsp. enterica]